MNTVNSINPASDSNLFSMQVMGTKVRKLREINGYTQAYVAFQLNISQAAYSKKESGRTDLSLSCLNNIAEIYHLTIVDLISTTTQELLLKIIKADSK
jgi:transcriptional regulator with XRE-family HTH domain